MTHLRRSAALAGLVGALAAFVYSRPGVTGGQPPGPSAAPANTVLQGFPAKSFAPLNPAAPTDPANFAACDTGWVVEWDITNPGNGPGGGSPPSSVLRIVSAKFAYKDKAGGRRWITVVRDLALGEVFVPYDPGSPRFEDVQDFSFWIQRADPALLGPPCVAPGQVLKSDNPDMSDRVYKEVHDDGIRWLDDTSAGGPDRGRRGEKMTLWANFYGANYRYLIEYGFTDDGVITARVGGTARNFFPRQPPPELRDTHLHVGCWAFDPDLGDPLDPMNGGPDKNVVRLVRRVQQAPGTADGRFRVDVTPFPFAPGAAQGSPAVEGSAVWSPEQFTALRIESTVRKNGNPTPQPTAYDLVPVRTGACRNFPATFEYANKDFWVTAADPAFVQFKDLPTYVGQPPRPADRAPVRVWHNSPLLHVARAEDFGPDGQSNATGVAIAAWAGFTLRPRNLFDSTPLYAP